MPAKHLPLAILAALALCACGEQEIDSDNGKPVADASAHPPSADRARGGATKQPAPVQPDPAKPLGEYVELKDGQQVMFQYVAASNLPPDYPKLAESFSQEYRRSNDAFRRNDLLQALQPQMEQRIQQARGQRHAWMAIDDAELGGYDFQRKGFPVGEFQGKRTRWFNDAHEYRLTWANRDQVAFAPVSDEAVARELESMRNDYANKPKLKVYFLAQSADLNAQVLNAQVTRAQLVGKGGRVLAEYGPDGSIPTQAAGDSDQEVRSSEDAADMAARALGGFL